MMHPSYLTALAALSLTVAAGALPAAAPSQDKPKQAGSTVKIPAGVDFRSSRWLSDREVVNDNNEKIANVSDLILDRGSGRINYLVVKTGTVLGLGGKTVAIPYSAFRWDGADSNFLLAATPEQLKGYPEFSAKDWSAMMESKLPADPIASSDPYTGSIDTATRARVEGTITKVERVRTTTFGEQVVVSLADSKGATQRVALGPSWFVNGGALVPMRGDKVVIETLGVPRDADLSSVAMNMRMGDREMNLRNSDGTPMWAVDVVSVAGKNYKSPYSRYVLLSSLRGMKVDCRGNECGKVKDVILDRKSGEIGFLSIDPDEHFLGIADTDRLVPWTVATVALDGRVRIDASKEMVIASLETPAELTTLNDGSTAQKIYSAYQVSAPQFAPQKPTLPATLGLSSAWKDGGPIITSIDHKTATRISGTVVDVTELKFDDGTQSAKVMRIKTGDTQETVVLGPSWYMDNQKLPYKSGDQVTVQACRANISGKPYWMASSVDSNGSQVVLIDPSTGPAWNKRDR